ncbi:COG1872 [hydrothermal vent metagenome]|uniref:COG1872 n=1 Tax=hydrothermal vent metagenome TaxID=652676 RepID=A0A3B0SRW0_9ZZZZ
MVKIGLREQDDGVVVDVWVVPGASRTEIVGAHDGALRIRVAAPPEGGKANKAVRKALVQYFKCTDATLVRGATSRRKQWLLGGISAPAARAILVSDKAAKKHP